MAPLEGDQPTARESPSAWVEVAPSLMKLSAGTARPRSSGWRRCFANSCGMRTRGTQDLCVVLVVVLHVLACWLALTLSSISLSRALEAMSSFSVLGLSVANPQQLNGTVRSPPVCAGGDGSKALSVESATGAASLVLRSPQHVSLVFATHDVVPENAFRIEARTPSVLSVTLGDSQLMWFDTSTESASSAATRGAVVGNTTRMSLLEAQEVHGQYPLDSLSRATWSAGGTATRATVTSTTLTLSVGTVWLMDKLPENTFTFSRFATSLGAGGTTRLLGQSVEVGCCFALSHVKLC